MTADCGILQTIDELHARLDEQPDEHTLRLVLADALEEAGGEHAELAAGYRALGRLGRVPFRVAVPEWGWAFCYGDSRPGRWYWRNDPGRLLEDWSRAVFNRHYHVSRRGLEDVVAQLYRPEFEEQQS